MVEAAGFGEAALAWFQETGAAGNCFRVADHASGRDNRILPGYLKNGGLRELWDPSRSHIASGLTVFQVRQGVVEIKSE
jgi:hypothetical protein